MIPFGATRWYAYSDCVEDVEVLSFDVKHRLYRVRGIGETLYVDELELFLDSESAQSRRNELKKEGRVRPAPPPLSRIYEPSSAIHRSVARITKRPISR